MIFLNLDSAYETEGLHPTLQGVIDFLKTTDFSNVNPGSYEIDGDDIFYNVSVTETQPFEERKGESHRNYIDVQCVIEGVEKMGFCRLDDSYTNPYDSDNDIIMYDEVKNEGYVMVTPRTAAIFFPADIHKPNIAADQPMDVKKVVVKVKADLIK